MINYFRQLICLYYLLLLLLTLSTNGEAKNRVKLRDIQTLTLYANQWTQARRSSPIKQLNCVGGYCNRAKIYSAQCYNRGSDGSDVQWECKAEMPSNYKFGRLEVSCEGYDYPEDDYVLVGSCGLEYTINEKTEQSHGSFLSKFGSNQNSDSFSFIPFIVIVGIIIFIYYTCLRGVNPSSSSRFDSFFPFSSRPSAPPPPGFRSEFFDSNSCSANSQQSSHTHSNSRWPGFMSGLAAGGLLGYLFGSSPNNTHRRYYTDPQWEMPSTSSGVYSSGSFTRSRNSSNDISTSTGFASTSRR